VCPQLKADGEATALLATGLQQQVQEAQARTEETNLTMAKMSGDHKIDMDAVASKTRGMAGIITQVSGTTIMLGGLPQSYCCVRVLWTEHHACMKPALMCVGPLQWTVQAWGSGMQLKLHISI
jgi:hypothetical protein